MTDAARNPAAVELGRAGGIKGGAARAARLTARERSAISRRAAEARWGITRRAPTDQETLDWAREELGRTQRQRMLLQRKEAALAKMISALTELTGDGGAASDGDARYEAARLRDQPDAL